MVVIHENYQSKKMTPTTQVGSQWGVLWNFLIGICIYFLMTYSVGEVVTSGMFQCQCFSYLWYRRPTCNYSYFMACAIFCSVIVSCAFSLFISVLRDSNVSIDSDVNPSYINLKNILYDSMMVKQLAIAIPFGVIFGAMLALVFQFNYLKDWVDYQNYRSQTSQNGGGVLIKTSTLEFSDSESDDEKPAAETPENRKRSNSQVINLETPIEL